MKSNQERSNGCLPPKKREILSLEHRPVVVAAATPPAVVAAGDSPHAENLAWLASVASERCRSRDAESPRCPASSSATSPSVSSPSVSSPSVSSPSVSSRSPFSSSSSSSSSMAATLSAVPLAPVPAAVYPTVALTAPPEAGGTIQYAQLAPGLQFISSGPYAGYISSHIISSSSAAGHRPQLDACYTTALISPGNKAEHHHHQHQHQQQFQIGLSPADLSAVTMAGSTQVSGQYIQLDSRAPLASPAAHLPLQLHSHQAVLPHTLTLASPQLLVQYTDAGTLAKKPEGQVKGLLNGELEVGKQAKAPPIGHHHHHHHHHQQQQQQQQQVQSYETRHILVPADYGQSPSGLQTSLVLVAQPSEPESAGPKLSLVAAEKGAVCVGKPASRGAPSFSSLPAAAQTTTTTLSHEELPAALYSSSAGAPQPPIIGYIASAGHQHALSYHAALPQHLVIPSGQSLLIPVSAGSSAEVPAGRPHLSTAMPHAYLATALSKCEVLGPDGPQQQQPPAPTPAPSLAPNQPAPAAAVPASPAPLPAPVPIQASSSTATSTTTPPSSPVALPPFFMRGSIIQLADGELKRVEDLRTEDFIQSAEISSELKIDSSTVERIDSGPTPNAVVIQFAVGELKAQVCVEVLVEYPFFVFGQGWSSCCPDRTTQLFELSCAKLCVGDVCVSLTLRGLRNGMAVPCDQPPSHGSDSSRKTEPPRGGGGGDLAPQAAGSNGGLPPKTSGGDQVAGVRAGGVGVCSAGQQADTPALPGGTGMRQLAPPPGEQDRLAGSRKRRWSAPERDQTERAEGEPPLTLPKPSFIPHEVKISIEGRSSTGS